MIDLENIQFGHKSSLYIVISSISTGLLYLGIEWPVLLFLSLAFIFDLFTGIWKAFVTKTFSSNINFGRIAAKVLMFGMILILALGIKAVLNINPKPFMYAIIGALGFNDILSSLNNIYTIYTGKQLPEKDFFPLVISLVQEKVYKLIRKFLFKIKK